jgi:hypothetical protein
LIQAEAAFVVVVAAAAAASSAETGAEQTSASDPED